MFARSVDDNLASLVKQIDKQVGNSKQKVFVTIIGGDADENEKKIKQLEKITVSRFRCARFEDESGPKSWKIAKEAEVTVMLYNKRKFTFTKGYKMADLNEDTVKELVGQVKKLGS